MQRLIDVLAFARVVAAMIVTGLGLTVSLLMIVLGVFLQQWDAVCLGTLLTVTFSGALYVIYRGWF